MSVKYLNDQWKFWLILVTRGDGPQQYVIEEIVTVTTLDNFFQFYQTLPHPDELKTVNQKRPSLALFRQGIKPAWEDHRNAKGGAFAFRLPSAEVNRVWEALLFHIVGGSFDEVVGPANKCLGIVVGPKWEDYGVEIWMEKVVQKDNEFYRKIEAFLGRAELAHDKMISFSFDKHHV
jgi:translation initiation factor 4E